MSTIFGCKLIFCYSLHFFLTQFDGAIFLCFLFFLNIFMVDKVYGSKNAIAPSGEVGVCFWFVRHAMSGSEVSHVYIFVICVKMLLN